MQIHGMSRALLEWTVRARVTALPGVRVVSPANATRLLATADSTRVTGVEFEREGATETLEADLVVDASGRGARAPRWLEALGYGAPPETVVKAGLAYTSAIFRMPEQRPDWNLLIQASPPVAFRSGLIGCIEGDRWIVSLTGLFGDHAPTDPDGFMQFAASLPEPDLHNALQYPQTEGVRPPGLGLITWFMGRVVRLGATDRPIMEKFLKVMHLLAPPTILFDPRTIFKVLTAT